MTGHEVHLTHQAVQQHVAGLVIRYGITVDGPEVEWTHSDLDDSMPAYSERVSTGGHELVLRSEEWGAYPRFVDTGVVYAASASVAV